MSSIQVNILFTAAKASQTLASHTRSGERGDFSPVCSSGAPGVSDFTHPNTPITIAGEPFAHLLYQFRLAFSGWRYVHIVPTVHWPMVLHKAGGAPKEHRTDSLSALMSNRPKTTTDGGLSGPMSALPDAAEMA